MRKLFYFILAAVTVVLAACGNGNDPENQAAQVKTGFENGTLSPWTTIDADGDGFNWDITEMLTHEGSFSAASHSYDNDLKKALTPDNYLVSPKVKLGGSISFWAAATDKDAYREHFGVFVSTTSNTDPDAFTMLQEWNMTDGQMYYLYQVDLSAYKGTEGYVAIRHFNCTDQYRLHIDDIKIE